MLDWYEGDPPGVKANLARILMPASSAARGSWSFCRSIRASSTARLAASPQSPGATIRTITTRLRSRPGVNAYAAPLGMIAAGSETFVGEIPTILKMNSSNSLDTSKDQAVTEALSDALRLGCAAVGFTIYPGSDHAFDELEELRELTAEAKAAALPWWSGAIRAAQILTRRRRRRSIFAPMRRTWRR